MESGQVGNLSLQKTTPALPGLVVVFDGDLWALINFFLFGRARLGDEHEEADDDDGFADDDASSLDRTEVGDVGQRVAAETKDVGHAGEHSHHVTGADQPRANFGRDGGSSVFPDGHEADVATETDERKPDGVNGDLHKADHRAAVEAKNGWAAADQKDDKTKQCYGEPRAHTPA